MPRAIVMVLVLLLPPGFADRPGRGPVFGAGAAAAAAQDWNGAAVRELVGRAIRLREAPREDSALRRYRGRAHGFVFYLAQFGRGFPNPPRLAKADELEVEVYWEAPGPGKQRIVRWREETWLPQSLQYHRDHLGIVTNNFGPLIRIGEGDEVRDAIHPLSREGLDAYDFAPGDTLTLRTARGSIDVLGVQVRPRDLSRPLVVGTLFLERTTAALVRFRFSFTPAAYRDADLEDISVVLEQALFEGRWWLPFRQEIEVRRRAALFEFPVRTIIRGRWDIEDYDFEAAFPAWIRAAPEYGGLTRAQPDTGQWGRPLRAAADQAEPFDRKTFDEIEREAESIVSGRLLEGLPRARFGAAAVSDLVRVNRVQGLALGFAVGLRFAGGWAAVGHAGYGFSDERVTGGAVFELDRGATRWTLDARRVIRDFADEPVISGLMNSILAQESGDDHGSWVLAEEAGIGLSRRLGGRWSVGLGVRTQWTASVATEATPVRKVYQPNPALGSGRLWLGRLELALAPRGALDRSDAGAALGLELGSGDADYVRVTLRGEGQVPVPLGQLRLRARAGWATPGVARARTFAIGGRGTLPGETYRGYGGRYATIAHAEYRIPVPVPAIRLGGLVTTGRRAVVAPFAAAGWAGGPISGLPWSETRGVLPVAGVAVEIFQQLLRLEAATRLRGEPALRLIVDVTPEWWPIL